MPKYRLFISFEVKPPDGSTFNESFDEIQEFKDFKTAQKELESITSVMISRFSDQGYEWTILDKCIEEQRGKHISDLPALIL